jgi:hypothetical protein
LDSTRDCLIVNSSIELSSGNQLDLNQNSNITALNLTFNNASVSFSDTFSELTVQWFLGVSVEDASGSPIANAKVVVSDNQNGTWNKTYYTNSTGWVNWIVTTEYIQNSTLRTYYSPYNITVSNDTFNPNNFNNNPRTVLMCLNREEEFYVIPEFYDFLLPIIILIAIYIEVKRYGPKKKR